ncbi:uncharacterized protein LOC117808509 [Xyrichtys novacula]|uniref:Uncharacterized protein LOC117808509 n=1 Tax=Xyrichtys novacula TaxID=13765 RepID=A0AAV1HAB4_XYRNO|nr:uncharacterized protein LOC117808509 [Xyrichtys novacula]
MSLNSTPQRVEQKFHLASKETLKPVIRAVLERLTAQNWQRLETGFLDPDTSSLLTDLCVTIIEFLGESLYESLSRRLEKQKGSATPVCEEDVQECLGNMGEVITQTVAEIQGVGDIHYLKCEQMTEVMVTAVTERVNSRLSKTSDTADSEEHKPPPICLTKLTGHLKAILKKCSRKASKMMTKKKLKKAREGEMSTSHQEKRVEETEDTAQAEQEFEKVESTCTLQEKEEVVVESTPTSVAVLQILVEQLEKISHDSLSYFTEEEDSLLLSKTSKDSELSELSFRIVEAFSNEASQDLVGEKQSCTKETLRHNRRKIIDRMRTVFVQTFARGSILSMMSKVRRKQASHQGQEVVELDTSQLIKSVDNLLTEVITPKDQDTRSGSREVCLFETSDSNISNGKLKSFAEKLRDTLDDHLTPLVVQDETHKEEIQTEVDNVVKRIRNWLKKQIRLHRFRKDSVSMTLREVEEVVLIKYSHLSSPKAEAEDQTYPTTVQEEVQSFKAEREEEEACQDEEEEACQDEEEEEEAYTPEEQVEQAQVAKASCEHTESVRRKWDRLTCGFIVKLFLHKVMKDYSLHVDYKSVEARLTDMLIEEMIGTDINVDLSLKSINKKCKAVYKDLRKKVGGGVLWISLLKQKETVIEAAAEALKKHFSPQRPSGIQKVLRRVFRPFTALLNGARNIRVWVGGYM